MPCTYYLCSNCMLIPDSGLDYTSSLLTAVFNGSSTAVVSVPTLPDDIVEGEENFTAIIIVPVDATTTYRVTRGTPATATVLRTQMTAKGVSCRVANNGCIQSGLLAPSVTAVCIILSPLFPFVDPQSADPLCTFQHCTTDRAALCTV